MATFSFVSSLWGQNGHSSPSLTGPQAFVQQEREGIFCPSNRNPSPILRLLDSNWPVFSPVIRCEPAGECDSLVVSTFSGVEGKVNSMESCGLREKEEIHERKPNAHLAVREMDIFTTFGDLLSMSLSFQNSGSDS